MDMETALWMGDIESWMDESFIIDTFTQSGYKPKKVKLITDKRTNKCGNFCFVTFSNLAEANEALFNLNAKKIPNTNIFFKLNLTKNNTKTKKNAYVGNLPRNMNDIELFNFFKSKYPSVYYASIITDNGISRGYGFVHFSDENEYHRCLNEMDGIIIKNKRINVKKIRAYRDYNSFNEENNKKNQKEKEKYNVFHNEDNIVKELMTKFENKTNKDKIPKLVRKRMAFNRLYDITNESKERIKNAKKTKKLYNLEDYQLNMLKALDSNSIDESEKKNLIQSFKELRFESDNIQSLPPINVNIIKDHVLNKKKETKKKSIKEIMNKDIDNLDDFEKEEKIIKEIKSYKSQPRTKRNKNFDMLPEYIREIFTKKLNYHS